MKARAFRMSRPASQQGFALVVALLLLLVLAILGSSAVSNNIMQERMAGNTRSRDLALQAAEAALKDAEKNLVTLRTLKFDGTVAGLKPYDPEAENDADTWRKASSWASYRSPSLIQALNQVAEDPRYIVEQMDVTATDPIVTPCKTCPCGSPPVAGCAENYRVTARGVGGEASAIVVLQAQFRIEP